MKNNELEIFIQTKSDALYSFAFVLIPDDLQASQLMIDSVARLLIQKKSSIAYWSQLVGERDDIKKEVMLNLLAATFEIARKRYGQLKMGLQDELKMNDDFYLLDLEAKAILYLRERENLEIIDVEFVTNMSKHEITAHLYSSRLILYKELELKHNAKFKAGTIE